VLRALAIAATVLVAGPAATAAEPAPPTAVTFRNAPVVVTGRASVGRAIEAAGAHPRSGNLLDVRGGVMRASAFPPSYTRNGGPAAAGTIVRDGDSVDYADGADVTEPSVVESYQQPGGNPERKLGSGTITVRRGLASGIVLPIGTAPDVKPTVALTFDDGPDPRWTPAVLDILARTGVRGTFFVVGRNADRYRDLVRREIAAGMSVGDHTWDHARLVPAPAGFVDGQMRRTHDLLAALGSRVSLFRPPYGRFDGGTVHTASSMGMRTVLWTVDSRDYTKPGVGRIVRTVLDRVRPGSIVLMHDGGGNRAQTLAALPRIIDALRARGYAFTALG
jgi:peptidoglycan/xylan/chitin deacetylase (PgdA/CDA1 family)